MEKANAIIVSVAAVWLWGAGLACGAEAPFRTEPAPLAGGLGAVEYRALLAQSLIQQIEQMKVEAEAMRQQVAAKEAQLKEVYDMLAQSRRETDKLRQHIADSEAEMDRCQQMLSVFRRGSFEYYEVRTGDTLESIAANPMVYGDATRAAWLRQANVLPDRDKLVPGTVLVIPRFPEGISYDL